jgi:hypothetical protein
MQPDSSIDSEALAHARALLRRPKAKSGVLPALAAAGFAAVSALLLAIVVMVTPLTPQSRDSLLNPEAEEPR